MNLSVYVGFCTHFVQLYDRLPSLEEQARQKQDFETQVEKEPLKSLLDVFGQRKRPCEICDDYRQFKGPDPKTQFMFGTFQSKQSALTYQYSGTVTYVPISETWYTLVQNKVDGRVQKTATTHEELVWQIELYNQLESKSLDPSQFTLQLVLFKNNEFGIKPDVQYQHAVFKKMLTNTRFKYQLDSGGNPSWLHTQVLFLPLNKGNITVQTSELDWAAQQQQQYNKPTQQSGFLPIDVQFNQFDGVEKWLEVSTQSQKNALMQQLEKVDTARMLAVQQSQNESELVERLKIRELQTNEIILGDQPVPTQVLERETKLKSKTVQLALCQFLWNLCSANTVVVPLMPTLGNTYVSEPQKMQYLNDVPGKRIAVPYVEIQKQGNISNLTRYQIIRQVERQFKER